jgi:hypothetical protein
MAARLVDAAAALGQPARASAFWAALPSQRQALRRPPEQKLATHSFCEQDDKASCISRRRMAPDHPLVMRL